MKDFGKRLKEERERLNMSQATFAERCGIGRTAQFNYERGERDPGSLYLDAAARLGVDTLYVMTGTRAGKDWAYARAFSGMLHTIEMLLGLEEGVRERLATERTELEAHRDGAEPNGRPTSVVDYGDWIASVSTWLSSASKLEHCVDAELLAQLIDAVSQEAENNGVALSTEKRLRAALMLYSGAKSSHGRTDPRLIAEAVKLAS